MKQVRGTKNVVELIGWMGGDPELRLTASGAKVCRFNVATRYITGQDGQGHLSYATQWTTVEAWERLAERCNTYLHKGSRVLVSGNLRTDSWNDKESGQPRSRTYVRAEDVLFLDSRPEANAPTEEEEAEDENVPF